MKRIALAIALVLLPTVASAQLRCEAPKIFYGDDTGTNPVQSVVIRRDKQTLAWSVVHHFRDGTSIDRSTQYAIRDTSEQGFYRWSGVHNRTPKLYMVGMVRLDDKKEDFFYMEYLFSGAGKPEDTVIMKSIARCASANPRPSTPAPVSRDSVPIYYNGKAVSIDITMGGQPVRMIIDTGASMSAITKRVGEAILASGGGTLDKPRRFELADGTHVINQVIRVHEIRVGRHIVKNALVGVNEGRNSADMLLGFDVLNNIGPFTIDTRAEELVFHTKAAGQ